MSTFADEVAPFLSSEVGAVCAAVLALLFAVVCFVWIARAARRWMD